MKIDDSLIQQVIKSGGDASKSPFSYATDTVSNIFNKDIENQMLINKLLTIQQAKESIKNKDEKPTGVYSFNPLTKTLEKEADVPKGSIVRNTMAPEDWKTRADIQQQSSIQGDVMKQAGKLGTAAKRLKILNQQMNESVQTSPNAFVQRISGPMQSLGAKTGLAPNPKLMAIKKNSRALSIQMIRAFGEVGNLSEPEQKSAADIVDTANMTHEERKAQVKQFAQFALAGARPEAVQYMIKDPDVSEMLKEFDIHLGDENRADMSTDASNTSKQPDKREAYNKLRATGLSAQEARARLGI